MIDFALQPAPGPRDEAGAAFWPTPPWAVEALLEAHPLRTSWVIEPSAGEGAIAEVLARRGHQVVAVELREQCWMGLSHILVSSKLHQIIIGDWLVQDPDKLTPPMVAFSIVGNPPFNPVSEAMRHIRHCVKSKAATVALLLPTDFIHSQKRALFWMDHPFSRLYALSRRPNTSPDSGSSCGGGLRNLSWFVWDRDVGPEQRVEVLL